MAQENDAIFTTTLGGGEEVETGPESPAAHTADGPTSHAASPYSGPEIGDQPTNQPQPDSPLAGLDSSPRFAADGPRLVGAGLDLGGDFAAPNRTPKDADLHDDRRLRLEFMRRVALPDAAPGDWCSVQDAALVCKVSKSAMQDAIGRRAALSCLWWGRRLVHRPTLSMVRFGMRRSNPLQRPNDQRGRRTGKRGRPHLNEPWPRWGEAGRQVTD